ncbi:hypothetical protein SPI_05921 [Niveomyces insectorum RCEF 264]|uniref:Uncharacterized protein n=1 Tax=Niveomyces insectorum RCEF 264 TaxID=1081102 RepID=A0A167SL48_9HYPO|nr:hypothetical protein SPI_05921 [Niveomyces insectorum RCEF 264]
MGYQGRTSHGGATRTVHDADCVKVVGNNATIINQIKAIAEATATGGSFYGEGGAARGGSATASTRTGNTATSGRATGRTATRATAARGAGQKDASGVVSYQWHWDALSDMAQAFMDLGDRTMVWDVKNNVGHMKLKDKQGNQLRSMMVDGDIARNWKRWIIKHANA